MKLTLIARETGVEITDGEQIIKLSDLDSKMHFESIGIQADGSPVVFDTCGNFGYLDPNKFTVTLDFLAE